jgi:tetratricopeptide (TPR) repeat protein
LDEAITEYREAIRLKPDDSDAHFSLGLALYDKGELDEAIRAYQAAIQINPQYTEAHYNLGNAMGRKGDLEGAIRAYQAAIKCNPKFAEAHCNLGQALRVQGRFAEALSCLRRGHELGSKGPRWPYLSAQWVKQCERLVALDGQLPAILKGEATPTDAGQRVDLAWICGTPAKQLYRAAVRFYGEAFRQEPRLVGEQPSMPRYNAACAAARAGCGAGKDAVRLSDKDSARLRAQALSWLRDDLAAWRRLLDKAPDQARPAVAQQMRHWLDDPAFARVRGPEALSNLPEAERQPWRQLWDDVADALARARGKTMPQKRSDGE